MKIIKRIAALALPTYLLTGCAVTEWLVTNADAIEKGGDTAEGFGAYGIIASLVASNVVSAAKWYENKATTKEVITAVQKSKNELDEDAKKVLVDAFNTHTPSKIKKVIAKVKKKL